MASVGCIVTLFCGYEDAAAGHRSFRLLQLGGFDRANCDTGAFQASLSFIEACCVKDAFSDQHRVRPEWLARVNLDDLTESGRAGSGTLTTGWRIPKSQPNKRGFSCHTA